MSNSWPGEAPSPINFKKGQVIYTEGEQPHYVYLIKSGSISLVKENEGRLIVIAKLRKQDFLGLDSFFANELRKDTAIATEDCEAYIIKRQDLNTAMKDFPEWVKSLMKTMGERLEGTMDVLRAHKIFDDSDGISLEFLPEEEVQFKKSIESYKKRKNL